MTHVIAERAKGAEQLSPTEKNLTDEGYRVRPEEFKSREVDKSSLDSAVGTVRLCYFLRPATAAFAAAAAADALIHSISPIFLKLQYGDTSTYKEHHGTPIDWVKEKARSGADCVLQSLVWLRGLSAN